MMHQKMPEAMKHSKGGMCKMCGGGACNYAEGGGLAEGGDIRSGKNHDDNHPKLKGLAEGGEVDMREHESDESDMHDGLGKELMGALESKDHKGVMRCIEAAILNCMNKGED